MARLSEEEELRIALAESELEAQDPDLSKVLAVSAQEQNQECKLDDYLKQNNYTRYTIYGDGNCLFRAFAYSLYNDPKIYTQIKSELYNYLLKIINEIILNLNNRYEVIKLALTSEIREIFKDDINEASIRRYIEYMKPDGKLGGIVEICLFYLYTSKQVHLYEKNKNTFEIYGSNTNGILYLYYCDLKNNNKMNHYDVLLPKLDNTTYIASEIPRNVILNKGSTKSFSCIPTSEKNIGPIEVYDDGNKSSKQGNEVNVDIYASMPITDRYQYSCELKNKLKYLKYKIKYLLIKNISQ